MGFKQGSQNLKKSEHRGFLQLSHSTTIAEGIMSTQFPLPTPQKNLRVEGKLENTKWGEQRNHLTSTVE